MPSALPSTHCNLSNTYNVRKVIKFSTHNMVCIFFTTLSLNSPVLLWHASSSLTVIFDLSQAIRNVVLRSPLSTSPFILFRSSFFLNSTLPRLTKLSANVSLLSRPMLTLGRFPHLEVRNILPIRCPAVWVRRALLALYLQWWWMDFGIRVPFPFAPLSRFVHSVQSSTTRS